MDDNSLTFFTIAVSLEDDDAGSDSTSASESEGVASPRIAVYHRVDIDTDSNSDGSIDPDNSVTGTDDPIETDDGENNRTGRLISVGGEKVQVKLTAKINSGTSAELSQWSLTLSASDTDKVKLCVRIRVTPPKSRLTI